MAMARNRSDEFYDVCYEVWRSGGNPDQIDRDRVDDYLYDGASPEDVAAIELRHQMPRHEEPEEMPWSEQQQFEQTQEEEDGISHRSTESTS
jgi:hypothetical protein